MPEIVCYNTLMKLKNPFNRLFSKPQSAPASPISAEDAPVETPESAIESGASWDDLAAVPFTGVASVTTESVVTPEQPLSPSTAEASIDADAPGPESFHPEAHETHEAPLSPELTAFKNFFKTDLRIKRQLMDTAPQPTDDYDEVSRMDYVDQAYRTFKGFHSDFTSIARDFALGTPISAATDDFFHRGAEHFAPGKYNSGVTEKIYRDEFTDMRPDFVEKVKDECVGYTLGGNLDALIEDSHTINELLHAYHSYIMNNEAILQRVPAIDEKQNDYGYNITLRGDDSALSRQVFAAIPDHLDVGTTDIIGADDHVMMMVRDRGHALTIGAEPDSAQPDQLWVEYNIPKLCNVEMIKALPGLAGYTQNGARGGFFTSRDELGSKIADFISQVPTDDDMVFDR